MTLKQFTKIVAERIPTPQEFLDAVHGQGWEIKIREDGTPVLAVGGNANNFAKAFARMLGREPYRTNVLNLIQHEVRS